jgi:flavorubredoxin
MKPVEIAPGIYDVGVNDWNIREFHGYSTPFGSSYNAFLIVDEKIALVDTVKVEFFDPLLENIARIVPPQKIDYVISNHTEMDHSGGRPRVMQAVGPHTPLYCGEALKLLNQHLEEMNFELVDPGLKIQYVPDHAALAQCFEFGRRIGQAVNQSVQP